MRLGLVPKTDAFYELFAKAGANALEAARLAETRFREYPSSSVSQADVKRAETVGDGITHDLHMLKYVLEMVGEDKVTLGSDYPFPLGDLEIGKFIEESDLPQATIEKIFWKNTLDWLNLDVSMFS